jgi:hypothetical protein
MPRHSARRLALLEKAGLVDHEDRIVIRQMLSDIIGTRPSALKLFGENGTKRGSPSTCPFGLILI